MGSVSVAVSLDQTVCFFRNDYGVVFWPNCNREGVRLTYPFCVFGQAHIFHGLQQLLQHRPGRARDRQLPRRALKVPLLLQHPGLQLSLVYCLVPRGEFADAPRIMSPRGTSGDFPVRSERLTQKAT